MRDPNDEHPTRRSSDLERLKRQERVQKNGMRIQRSQMETRRLLKRDVIKKARSCGFIRLISQLGRRFAYVKHSELAGRTARY